MHFKTRKTKKGAEFAGFKVDQWNLNPVIRRPYLSNVLVIPDSLAISAITKPLVSVLVINVFAQEMDRAINKQKVCSTNMLRPESPADIPIVRIRASGNSNLRRQTPGASCKVVDGNDRGCMEIPDPIRHPETSSVVIVTRWQNFTHVNRV